MSAFNYYLLMADYNRWMNRNLYDICTKIPDEMRKADRDAFFRSIHGTLNHLLYGDRVWMGRFTGQLFRAPHMGQSLYSDFEELRQAREAMDQQILDWTATLSEEWLAQPLTYTSGVDSKTRRLPAWMLVTHMFNHQIHHRGQLTTLLNQLGHDPGITDLPWLPSLNSASGSYD